MKNRIKALFFAFLLISFTSALAAEQVFFYHTDPAGTPLSMTDTSGNVVWRADYKPFGEENTVAESQENDKRFVGKEKDEETGHYYFGARYMDPKTGRFIAVDPVRAVDPGTSKTNEKLLLNPQSLNPYAYSLNNPYRYVDPDGRDVRLIARRLNTPLLGGVGVHTFIEIKPDNPKDFNGATRWVIGGYESDGKLVTQKNKDVDLNWDEGLKGNYLIPAPNGKSDTEFIQDVMKSFNKYKSGSRNWKGYPEISDKEGNCNTVSTGALVGAGVPVESIKKFNPSGLNPGIGNPLPEMLR